LSPDASCAVALGGAAYCWTRAFDAQTASFAQLDSVSQGLRVVSITGAAAHRCAILQSDASLLCWGNNDVGQLGNGSKVSTTTPSPVIAPPPS
jgi:alpha-tubulin suppressor-like RCC1 family protein